MKTEEFDLFLLELLGTDMSMNETAKTYGLPDVVASLCKSGSTGRLQINVGSTRGAFFFKDGQLIDARVGTLIGFAAVNLAISSGATVLNFDSSIAPPAPRFTDPNERRLLKTRFGIDTAGVEVQSAQRSGGERKLSLVAQASAAPPSLEPPARTEVSVPTASVAPLDSAGAVPNYESTQLKKATAPLNVARTAPLTPPPAATAPLSDASVHAQETIVPLKVASVPANPATAALRDTVAPLRIAGPRPRPAIAAQQEVVVPVNVVAAPPQTATDSLRDVTAPLKDISVPFVSNRKAIPSLGESAKKALTSLLSPQTLSLVKTHAKASSLAVQKKLTSVWQSLLALDKQSINYLRNKKTAVRAASIALILILAAVGFASYWSKGKETTPSESSPPPAAGSLRLPAVAPPKTPGPSTTPGHEQSITTKSLTKVPADAVQVKQDAPPSSETANRQLRSSGSGAATNKMISSKTVADGTSETKESGAAEAPSQTPEEKQLAKPSSRGIAVEVRVEGGRVSEAFIKNPRPGMEGYEATALRLARQRRYSKETTTTQTVVFQVNGEH